MILFKHELKQNRNTLLIWTGIIGFMLALCVFIYPEMESQMGDISGTFAEMGSFSAAFGMDRINFGEFMGFFSIECGNILGLGGAFFAALLGILALSKEEKGQTAEFLLTHPVSRGKILLVKYCSVISQIVILNTGVVVITALSVWGIGETPDIRILALLFLAYFILQIEIASICFGISAFIKGNGMGAGLGIAACSYFLNILANLTEHAKFLKFLTPFGYAEGADIIADRGLNGQYLAAGLFLAVLGVLGAFFKYLKKDIG